MTIEVEIRNNDKARIIEVGEVHFDKRSGRTTTDAVYKVYPGLNYITTVHALKGLIIRELEPEQQMRPK